MTQTTRRRYLTASGGLGLATLAGCVDGGPGEEEPEQEPADDQPGDEPPDDEEADEEIPDDPDDNDQEPVEDVDHEDPDGTIEFGTLEDGDEVTGPVEIEAEVDDFDLEPAGEDDVEDGTGHLHVIVDHDCVDPGYRIPHESGYHHLEDGEAETEIELEPGEYDLCLQAGDGIHDAYALTDDITIEVLEADDEQ